MLREKSFSKVVLLEESQGTQRLPTMNSGVSSPFNHYAKNEFFLSHEDKS